MTKELYFAYGSNLSTAQMKQRCPSAVLLGTAKLCGHALCFPRKHYSRAHMGVAGIEECKDGIVEGLVYQMSMDDIIKLDGFENVPADYVRDICEVKRGEGGDIKVWTYFSLPDGNRNYRPSDEYLDIIIQGATAHGLSQDYIENLEKWRSIDL